MAIPNVAETRTSALRAKNAHACAYIIFPDDDKIRLVGRYATTLALDYGKEREDFSEAARALKILKYAEEIIWGRARVRVRLLPGRRMKRETFCVSRRVKSKRPKDFLIRSALTAGD